MDSSRNEHDDRQSIDKSRSEKISEQRKTLPIYAFREDIVNTIKTHQILILVGETGSGKTTQLAQYLYEEGLAERGLIGITQPRRVGAVSVARRVCEERGTSLGDIVGYSVRFSDKTTPTTKIKYMTDGVMLRECLMDPLLRDYSVIILDEAHERSVHTDILFGLMKVSLAKRPDLKLLITSATLDDEKFSKFFDDCPTFFVPGRSFPVDIFHADKKPRTDIVEGAVETALNIHLNEPEGDILVFLTGQQEIEDACARVEKKLEIMLRKLEEEKSDKEILDLVILPLYAALPPGEQIKIFEPTPTRTRKLVFATNIAETSLTVNGIVYVIDPGYVKQKIFNPRTGMESLEVVLISKVAAQQRAGRAGRTKPGKCFRLYTQSIYNEMDDVTVPEIQRSNLSNIVLTLKALGIHDVLSFQFLDPPDPFLLVQAMKHLYQLGALDEEGRLTKIGKQMSIFPLEPSYSRMLLGSIEEHCSDEMLTLISMLSVENLFFRPSQKKLQDIAEEKRRELYVEADKTSSSSLPGDHVMLLYIFDTWQYYKRSNVWTKEYFIQHKALEEANEIRKQLVELMKKEKLEILRTSKSGKYDRIAHAMCSGLYMNYARHSSRAAAKGTTASEHMYVIPKTGQLACVHPMSLLIVTDKEPPVWVVYTELIQTTRPFLRLAIGVKYEWIDDLISKSGKVDVNKLIGRDVREIIAASMVAPKGEEEKKVENTQSPSFQRKNDDSAVEAARQRYLARKAAQEANQPSKKKKTQ